VRHTVHVICSPELAAGFATAAVPHSSAQDGEAAARALAQVPPETGVVLIEERLLASLPLAVRRASERRALPLLAAVPNTTVDARGSAEAAIVDILRRAVGYRVRAR
jgi:vacuolar-type H+-ATPase subunit F/Vma7